MSFELHPDLARDGILVGHFDLCLALLINDSNYPWFVLVPQRSKIRDPIDLDVDDHTLLWTESRSFSGGIMQVFNGEKLNVAALGNVTPQLHVHHVVRYHSDPAWPSPVWGKTPPKPYEPTAVQTIRERLAAADIDAFLCC